MTDLTSSSSFLSKQTRCKPRDNAESVEMAWRTTIDTLYNRIEHEKVKSVSGKYFIQEHKVREIFTPAIINLAVAELICDAPERLGLAKKIQQDGTIVFAILVSMGKADHIVSFRNHECLDRR